MSQKDSEFCTAVAEEYPDYLRDESRRVGTADSISFPQTESDIREHLARAHAAGTSVTIQGARTGIAAIWVLTFASSIPIFFRFALAQKIALPVFFFSLASKAISSLFC